MMVIVSYDIGSTDKNCHTRLRRVAKVCQNYGQRVQNSVFECIVDYQTYLMLKKLILEIMDKKQDSIRFYLMGNKFEGKVEHFGIKKVRDLTDTLII